MTHDGVMRPPLRGWPGTGCEGELVDLGGGLHECLACGQAVSLGPEPGSEASRVLGVYPSYGAARLASRRIEDVLTARELRAAKGGGS